ncbi:uncharacterized protein LOC126667006 [Mercurialis annua]|uniref:uncharacterized protein LOC126667006 n=1 Tax=Mercurialis annua TaxID=3986 RepID=UPI00215E3154|nr:uncharacterized protein LOC126667006 [Mercurialis annua]
MKSKQVQNEIRVFGQRSISSSFFSKSPSIMAKDSKNEAENKGINKNSSISLSDFLDQKLHTNPVLKKIVKGKSTPFKSPLGSKDDSERSIDNHIGNSKVERGKKSVVDQVVFEKFKPISAEIGHVIDNGGGAGDETGTSNTIVGTISFAASDIGTPHSNNEQVRTSERVERFEDCNGNTGRRLLVLGDDSKVKRKGRREGFVGNKKQRPSFNHYGNGSGWWDCDMEGVDDEEVGLGDVWEGVGSTTFGVIDWH